MAEPEEAGYALEAQVGHLLRRAHQRATAIFLAAMQAVFAALDDDHDAGFVERLRAVQRTIGAHERDVVQQRLRVALGRRKTQQQFHHPGLSW